MKQNAHPQKGLYLLFVTEMAERFSYYGMRALFILYLFAAFFSEEEASQVYGSYTGLVYLTPLLGGYIACRYWGNRRSIIVGGMVMAIGQFLMFISACFASRARVVKDVLDMSVDNHLSLWLMFAGLAALIIGNGFFKPNITTMVGDLYSPQNSRKDSAFTLFYMGINIGAFIAPIVCGCVSVGASWANPSAYKWGFLCAAIAMVFSTLIFVIFKNKYLVTPDGQPVGLAPSAYESLMKKEEDKAANRTAPIVKNSPLRLWGCLIATVVLFALFAVDVDNFNDYISAAVYAISITLPVFIITDRGLTSIEKMRIGAIYIIAVFVIFFWTAYEQAGSSLTFFADHQCDRYIGGWEMPTTWFQSINPIAIVCLAPVMSVLWDMLSKYKLEPSSPVKQAIGLGILSLGYIVIAIGTNGVEGNAKASMWWLFALYIIHTIAELALSPIGMSMVSKLSPARFASLLMGVWFMSSAASNILAGKLSTLLPTTKAPVHYFCGFEIASLTDFFTLFAVMSGVASILLLCLCPCLKKMMKGCA